MPEPTSRQVTSQWRLAGWLCAALTLVQMFIFCVLMIQTSLVFASMNYWILILGFSITGVTAAVCTSRAVRRSERSRSR